MKRLTGSIIAGTAIAAVLAFALVMLLNLAIVSQAAAEDKLLEAVAKQVVVKIDKNGNHFMRVIIEEERTIKGIKYTATVPVNFFGDLYDQAEKTITKGQSFKVIANKRFYKDNPYYTVLAIIQ